MDTHERLQELHKQHMALSRERNLVDAKIHDVDAEHDDLIQDSHGAAWHRAQAKALRSGALEDQAESHRLWVLAMAHAHLRNGTVPVSYCAQEIEQAMDVIRGEHHAA